MRLINVHTMKLEEFIEGNVPPYCILSHRWGEDEVSYKDYSKGRKTDGPGYRKICDFAKFVREREVPHRAYRRQSQAESVDFVWIDTCCIDKRSSAELQESVNCMFKWYQKAVECHVYLSDVRSSSSRATFPAEWSGLHQSSWFRRGWTLQVSSREARALRDPFRLL